MMPLVLILGLSAALPCDLAPGTQIASLATSGGNGRQVTLKLTSATGDFVMQGAAIVVAPAGIRNCGGTQNVTVRASQ